MGKVCQFIGVVVWIIGAVMANDVYKVAAEMRELQEEMGVQGGEVSSVTVQGWISVIMLFVIGLVLLILGTMYDDIKELQERSGWNWSRLWVALERMERMERKISEPSVQTKQTDMRASGGGNLSETMTPSNRWMCPKCGLNNFNKVCLNCGFPKER